MYCHLHRLTWHVQDISICKRQFSWISALLRKLYCSLSIVYLYALCQFFFIISCCLSVWYFRLEESMHRTPPAWGHWLPYVPLCWLRAWEPIERLTRPQPKHFTVKLYYRDQYWRLVTCCRFMLSANLTDAFPSK